MILSSNSALKFKVVSVLAGFGFCMPYSDVGKEERSSEKGVLEQAAYVFSPVELAYFRKCGFIYQIYFSLYVKNPFMF